MSALEREAYANWARNAGKMLGSEPGPWAWEAWVARGRLQSRTPINMVLHCPTCHTQHIDAPEPTAMCHWCGATVGESDDCPRPAVHCDHAEPWTNRPHRSHLCHSCGTIWRPADVPTNGVQSITTRSEKDTWP